ncbi:MAG TPA: PEP-CTERM sorting domain-containing protein [Verrucomicrobiae bacterium]|nr:PEP-CTERM sorting domain-containing protein [Verrucomicrobiae bacterium]
MRRPLSSIAVAALCAMPCSLPAQNTLWTNFTSSGNSWLNPTNWNNGVPSGVQSSTALINQSTPNNYVVTHDQGTNSAFFLRLANSSANTANLVIAPGTLLSITGPGGALGLSDNSLQLGSGSILTISGALDVAGGISGFGNSVINIHGGLLTEGNTRGFRIYERSTINIEGSGRFTDGNNFEIGGGAATDNAQLRIINGSADLRGVTVGLRGTGTLAIASSGVLTNLNGDISLANRPPSGNVVSHGRLYSTGTVFNTGNLFVGRNFSNAASTAIAVISGGSFLQMGNNTKAVDIGRENTGSLIVEGGSFISTNNMRIGLTDRTGTMASRGDGTVLVTGSGALAVTNPSGNASITVGSLGAVADADRAIGRLTVAGGSLSADMLRIQNGAFTNSGGTSTIGSLIASNVTASVAFSAGTLNLGGSAISNGQALVVGDGSQTATLNLTGNGTHLLADGLLVASNSMLLGVGNIAGNITNFGTIAPGISPGIISVSGDAVLAASSLMAMELAGTNATEFDQFNVGGMLGFEGTLTVTLTNGFNPQVGDTFDLFDFGSTNGLTFDQLNLPTLVNALWDTSDLYVGGSIAVVIPEPATVALLGIGIGLLLAARRRH